jgi:DNA-directed RNA polymerase subunit RPC12/RpoP
MRVLMRDINLEDATINLDGEWLSVEVLTRRIQQKMQDGDLKFANLATALEDLNTALENTHVIETKIVISEADYKQLKELGDGDSHSAVRKAVMAFIKSDAKADSPDGSTDKKAITCTKCNTPIELVADEIPTEIECPECGTRRRLKPQDKKDVRHKDHFLG